MTVLARRFASIPTRSATETWQAIVSLVAPDAMSPAQSELAAVGGVMCSVIAQEALRDDALVLHGSGPRLRVYCLYGDDALEPDAASESPLSFVPTEGDWQMSVPCHEDDLAWVTRALARRSSRVHARAVGTDLDEEQDTDRSQGRASVNLDSYLRG